MGTRDCPGRKIVLVEANSQSLSDLMAAVTTAASQSGVSVVSMSWGFPEGVRLASDEATYDAELDVPGVTFVASTGDFGAADSEYPAYSPNVVAVGGTTLNLDSLGSYGSELGWGSSPADSSGVSRARAGALASSRASLHTSRAYKRPAAAPSPTWPWSLIQRQARGLQTRTTCRAQIRSRSSAGRACQRRPGRACLPWQTRADVRRTGA